MVDQEKLIIYLHAEDLANPSWATSTVSAQGDVERLTQAAMGRKVVVIVPGQDVLLTSTFLPKMSRTRLMQALPYALEEQLIADIDELHFALQEPQSDGSLPVAVVAKEKMHQWCLLLKSWQIQPAEMIPAMLALPPLEQIWQIVVQDMGIARLGLYQGFEIENNSLLDFLHLALQTNLLQPSEIHIHNYTNHAYAPSLPAHIKVQENFLLPEQKLNDLRTLFDPKIAINLLQGSFGQKKSRFPELKVKWKISVYIASLLFGLLIVYPGFSYFLLKQRLSAVNTQIAAIYKRNFPQATSVVAPKNRLQEKLENLMGEVGQNRLLMLIGQVGKGMAETSGIKLKRYDFQNSQLTVELNASSSEDIAKFTDFLTQQGLSVKQQNADFVGARLQATLVIE